MRAMALVALLIVSTVGNASDIENILSGNVDIQPVAKAETPFQSKEQLLAATRSGEISEKYLGNSYSEEKDDALWRSILVVLKNEYGVLSVDANYQRNRSSRSCSWQARPYGISIFNSVTQYKSNQRLV
ncbi:MAG: hypothetical protein ACRDF4_02560, partial [Rhabdochlamydiaceae bacterium]